MRQTWPRSRDQRPIPSITQAVEKEINTIGIPAGTSCSRVGKIPGYESDRYLTKTVIPEVEVREAIITTLTCYDMHTGIPFLKFRLVELSCVNISENLNILFKIDRLPHPVARVVEPALSKP
jgi:hypothetical protein